VEAKPLLDLNPPPPIKQQPAPVRGDSHVDALMHTEYPIHDYFEATLRLARRDPGPRTVTGPAYALGDRQTFTVGTTAVDARLRAITEHLYFWVDERLEVDETALTAAADRFENSYYGQLTNLFGQEWRPGIDNDPHFSVLHVEHFVSSTDELGHFNSGDEYPRTFFGDSNQQELIYLNMRNLTLGSDLYFGTLVHEFQHLSQWYVDANETTWLNEGLSQLAELYVGLETADALDYALASNTQLNHWDYASENVYAHYGATYLFSVYLWEQLGEGAVRELARHPGDGLAAVDAVLGGYRPDVDLPQFLSDWAIANYLDDASAGTQYAYRSLALRRPESAAEVRYTPFEAVQSTEQFGVNYTVLELEGPLTISFAGDTIATLLPTVPHSGTQVWFAPAQENVNSSLTARFDLTGLDEATLSFWAWYDLQPDLDYAYVSVSGDGGATWQLLSPDHASQGEHGPAWNGQSSEHADAGKGGWVEESLSLDSYAGGPLLVRFDVLTYYQSTARGFALDDISIPELEYRSDVEDDDGTWQAFGFAQVGTTVPQGWSVQLIDHGAPPRIVPLQLDAFSQGRWTVDIGPSGGTVVVMALTPFVYEPAHYWLYVEQ
jgi:hypothetical protein